ncbi:MAG: F0F1 ATP synthase subunit gamma [Methanotrichaceae archaeon]
MEELERLKSKIKNASELQSVVKIMKTISAANIREYGQAAESLIQYNKTIEMGLQVVMLNNPDAFLAMRPTEEEKRLGVVIFGSDQGLAGRFNEQIAGYAIHKINEIENQERIALAVGERIVGRLEEEGLHVETHLSFFEKTMGITQVMTDVLVRIEEWRLQRGINQIILFYNRPTSGASFAPQMSYLFPLDMNWLKGLSQKKWPSRSLPTFSMDADKLFSSLVRQYLFFSLYRAFVESLASENASRLMAMQMAERNIEEHMNELTVQFNRRRQEAISEELLDVVTGFEALMGGGGKSE